MLPARRDSLTWLPFALLAIAVLTPLGGLAHADPVAAAPVVAPASTDWTGLAALLGMLLGGFATILGGVSVILHVIAPRTKTTIDNKVAAVVDEIRDDVGGAHDKLDQVLAIVKPAAKVGLLALLLGTMAAPALTGCGSTTKAAATTAEHAVVNCTGQAIGQTPGLDLDTLAAIARTVSVEKARCTVNGALVWKCVEDDAILEGKVLGGCSLVEIIASVVTSSKAGAVAAAAPMPDPGHAALEDFRARVAGGAKFHTATGDI